MPESRIPIHAGGCQRGTVRYALYAEPTNPHVCHCRMCQKAFGSYFAPLAGVKLVASLPGTGTKDNVSPHTLSRLKRRQH